MLNGDALLSFFAVSGNGSWRTFERAVEDVTGLNLQSYFTARAFSARGLVEFDWLGDRSWSVPPLTIVRLQPGRLLSVGLINDDLSGLLRRNGYVLNAGPDMITKSISYTRSEILDADGTRVEALEQLSECFHVERSSFDAGFTLLSALPQIGSMIDSRPPITLDAAIRDGELRFLDPDSLTFKATADEIESELIFEILRVKRLFAAPEYYYVDQNGARRIELELAFTYAAGRAGSRFLHYAAGALAIEARVPLPILIERALHLSGARFAGLRRATDGKRYLCFEDVAPHIARTIAIKLLTAVEDLPQFEPLAISGD
jgi:hypothetical protein